MSTDEAKKPIQETEEYKIVAEGLPTHETMDRLTTFLYELMRDRVLPGVAMEYVVRAQGNGPFVLSNGYLGKFAEHLAHKIRNPVQLEESEVSTETNLGEGEFLTSSDNLRVRHKANLPEK